MSKINFVNKSNITVCVTVGKERYTLYPSQIQGVVVDEDNPVFSVCPDSVSRIDYLLKFAGIISKRHFVLDSDFQLQGGGECEVSIYTNTARGKFRDEYEYCVTYCSTGEIAVLEHKVRDGESFRRELELSAKKGRRALLVMDFFEILGNALVGVLLLVIPFLLIWLFSSLELAWNICSIAFIPIFVIIVVINRLMDKAKKTLWKKGKSFALRKSIFKDYNSYFSREYIFSVINGTK